MTEEAIQRSQTYLRQLAKAYRTAAARLVELGVGEAVSHSQPPVSNRASPGSELSAHAKDRLRFRLRQSFLGKSARAKSDRREDGAGGAGASSESGFGLVEGVRNRHANRLADALARTVDELHSERSSHARMKQQLERRDDELRSAQQDLASCHARMRVLEEQIQAQSCTLSELAGNYEELVRVQERSGHIAEGSQKTIARSADDIERLARFLQEQAQEDRNQQGVLRQSVEELQRDISTALAVVARVERETPEILRQSSEKLDEILQSHTAHEQAMQEQGADERHLLVRMLSMRDSDIAALREEYETLRAACLDQTTQLEAIRVKIESARERISEISGSDPDPLHND